MTNFTKSLVQFVCHGGEFGIPQLFWQLSQLLHWSLGQPCYDLIQKKVFLFGKSCALSATLLFGLAYDPVVGKRRFNFRQGVMKVK